MPNEKSISPSIAAFAVLMILFLGVGLYVRDRDLNTTGVTAQESLLPNVAPGSDTIDLVARYPAGWQADAFPDNGNGYRFTPTTGADTTIQIQVVDQSFESYVADLQAQNADAPFENYPNPVFPDRRGITYSTSAEGGPGQPRQVTDVVVLETLDERSLQATLNANANTINAYRNTFDLIVNNLSVQLLPQVVVPARDSLAAPELSNISADNGSVIQISAPAEWTVEGQENTSAYGVNIKSSTDADATSIQVFLLAPQTTAQNLGISIPLAAYTPADILRTYLSASNVRVITDVTPATLNGMEGATALVRIPDQRGRVREVGVYTYSDKLLLSYILETEIDKLAAAFATIDAMLATVSPIQAIAEVPSVDASNAEVFTQTTYSQSMDVTFTYPETWTVDPATQIISLTTGSADDPSQRIQAIALSLEDTAARVFQVTPPDELTPTTILQAFQANTTLTTLQAVTDYQAGDYTGAVILLVGGPLPGQLPDTVLEIGIVALPDGRYLTFIADGKPDLLPQLRANANAFVGSIEIGDTTTGSDTSDSGEAPPTDSSSDTPEATDTESTAGTGNESESSESDSSGESDSSTGQTGLAPQNQPSMRIIG